MEKLEPDCSASTTTIKSPSDKTSSHTRSRRLRSLPAFVACGLFLVLAVLYLAASSLFNMSATVSSGDSTNPAHVVPVIPITVVLSALPSIPHVTTPVHGPSFHIKVTLTNTSPSSIVILKWWSPLEAIAAAMGIFKVTDMRLGTEVECLGVMVDYLMPDNETFILNEGEDASSGLQRIGAGASLSRELEIRDPEVQVKTGRKYSIKAKGQWMAVWMGDNKDGRYSMRDAISHGTFESEAVEVQT